MAKRKSRSIIPKGTKANGSEETTKFEYPQHEYGKLMPEMSTEQYTDLKNDIAQNGIKDKIIMFEGSILEGWHRYKATCELGSPFKGFDHFRGTKSQALSLVVSKNLMRRHMTTDQRAMVLASARKMLIEAGVPSGDDVDKFGQMAEHADINRSAAYRAKTIAQKGIDELQEAVRDGEIGTKTGEEIAKLPEKQQKKALKATKAPPKAPPKEENVKSIVKTDVVYTGTWMKDIRTTDPPAKRDSTWFFRCKPDEVHMAFEVISAQGFEVQSFMTVTTKSKHSDPFTDGSRDLVLIATHGDPSPVDRKAKFPGVMPEQQFLEHFAKAYPDNKTTRATFFGTKPSPNWQDWKSDK